LEIITRIKINRWITRYLSLDILSDLFVRQLQNTRCFGPINTVSSGF